MALQTFIPTFIKPIISCPLSQMVMGRNKSQGDVKLDSFLSSGSTQYIELMYKRWLKNPSEVHPSWDAYFRLSKDGNVGYASPPTLGRTRNDMPMTSLKKRESNVSSGVRKAATGPSGSSQASQLDLEKHLAVQNIIRGYQVRGHFLAKIDPIDHLIRHSRKSSDGGIIPDIISTYKLSKADLNKSYLLPRTTKIGGKEKSLKLKEVIKRLEKTYCGSTGIEYMYIPDVKDCDWIRKKFETPGATKISKDKKKLTLARLARAQLFENFCGRKYSSEKRFGLEGLEATIPCLKTIMDKASQLGVDKFVIGMAHRGRLNVLVNVCHKSLDQMFARFEALKPEDDGSGDIKYHLGVYLKRFNKITKKNMTVVVLANPSHLQTVCPVTIGRVKAEQFYRGDTDGSKTLGILLHGDAAFTGQGVNFEVINVASLPAYTTFGTIHIITNNQIGFTTDRRVAGSSPYSTDVARVINSPIFHVNADDPEAVVYASEVATEWRQKFKKDAVIDIVGYRKFGHQEVDDPMYTHPTLYKRIRKMKSCFEKYSEKLIKEKVVTAAEIKEMKDDFERALEGDWNKSKKEKGFRMKGWLDSPWGGFFEGKDPNKMIFKPGIRESTIKHICKAISSPPPPCGKFVLYKGLERILNNRKQLMKKRKFDFAMAEAIAYGSLLKQGVHVRITGEDVERGTFTHRHHVYTDQNDSNKRYRPLNHLYPDQAAYTCENSCLTEYCIMGFEHGYSVTSPMSLVTWEAQFGDFANTGQPVIDQFIANCEAKWARQCGMVLSLPHGLEGQGPEHSSIKPERYLDMTAEDPDQEFPTCASSSFSMEQLKNTNWIITYNTIPANVFHGLRRQVALPFRKPLVLLGPKSLLRNPQAISSFDEILEGTSFKRIIPDKGPASKKPKSVQKLIFCSGKYYYDAAKVIKDKKLDKKIALVRVEQVSPFPFDLVSVEIKKYAKAQICWLQEEHKNQGFWDHMEPRIRNILRRTKDKRRDIQYIGRDVSAASATGLKYLFQKQQKKLHKDIITLPSSC